jgi:hypothetical protein
MTINKLKMPLESSYVSWARWYTPVITALWRQRQENQVQSQSGLHSKTLSQKKNKRKQLSQGE